MGYTIQYEPEKNRKYPLLSQKRVRAGMPLIAAVSLVALLGIGIRTGWLIPGDPQVTADAFTQMVDSLQAGESVKDAVTVFCTEVLEHGRAS